MDELVTVKNVRLLLSPQDGKFFAHRLRTVIGVSSGISNGPPTANGVHFSFANTIYIDGQQPSYYTSSIFRVLASDRFSVPYFYEFNVQFLRQLQRVTAPPKFPGSISIGLYSKEILNEHTTCFVSTKSCGVLTK